MKALKLGNRIQKKKKAMYYADIASSRDFHVGNILRRFYLKIV